MNASSRQKGRPKGARHDAAKKESIIEKRGVAELGEFCHDEAWLLIQSILVDRAFETECEKAGHQIFGDGGVSDRVIVAAIRNAVLRGDSSFFERCGRALDWFRQDGLYADSFASQILGVIWDMLVDSTLEGVIQPAMVLKRYAKKFPNLQREDTKSIRRVVRQLGLSFPLDLAILRAAERDSVRRYSEKRLQQHRQGP